jgi:hypothetical protein
LAKGIIQVTFGWDNPKRVEQINRGTGRTIIVQATPRQIVTEPFGYRSEDIMHSLCLVAAELIAMEDARALSFNKVQTTLRENIQNAKQQSEEVKAEGEAEVEVEGKGDSNDQDIGNHPPKTKKTSRKRKRVT